MTTFGYFVVVGVKSVPLPSALVPWRVALSLNILAIVCQLFCYAENVALLSSFPWSFTGRGQQASFLWRFFLLFQTQKKDTDIKMLQRIARHGNSMRAPARQCLRCCLAAKSSMPARSDESSSIAPSASSRSSRESRGTASLTYSPRYEEPASSSTMKSGLKRRIPGQSPQTSAATSAKQPQHQALPQPAVIVTNSSQHSAPSFYRRQLPTTHCIPFR